MKQKLTNTARNLRQRHTDAERKLWNCLRDRRLGGYKFKRQVPRGRYVVDFFCAEAGLIIEVDGGQHAKRVAARDRERTAYLESEGLSVLRFWNNEVLQNTDGVLEVIDQALQDRSPPHPARRATLSPRGEG